MAKPRTTRTYGPIHFEDLDPRRFEDLIRELIYDFKDWQSIEATGRSGGDNGFDIRAYEKVSIISQIENQDDEVAEEIHPMEGNLWMIQGKREKEIGPKKLGEYLAEVDEKNPPYGYILVASTNFSKKSYDLFREELRKKGVMEFYLWSKAELEDMLHFPKNDRILFTFFGISLVSKRRSRTTEIQSAVNIKNKLYRILGEGRDFYKHVLIRDLKDTYYPYEKKYKDFDEMPRWKEYVAFGHHPLGLLCHDHEYLAYVDTKRKEWDFTKEVDLIHRRSEDVSGDELNAQSEKREQVNDVYDFFPRSKQGRFAVERLVKYTDIALVDEKGDQKYDFSHLYVDFMGDSGPFAGGYDFLKIGEREVGDANGYKRISVFPKQFEKSKFGKIYKAKKITLNQESLKEFREYKIDTLYDSEGNYGFLKPRDIIQIANPEGGSFDQFIQITYKFKTTIKDYLLAGNDTFQARRKIGLQLAREFDEKERIDVYEFKMISRWQFEKKTKD